MAGATNGATNGAATNGDATNGAAKPAAAAFSKRTFTCNEEKLGFVYEARKVAKVVPGLWAEKAGLKVGDLIVSIQKKDGNGEMVDFGTLTPKEKLIQLKQPRPVKFQISRTNSDETLHAAARSVQARWRNKKSRADTLKVNAASAFWKSTVHDADEKEYHVVREFQTGEKRPWNIFACACLKSDIAHEDSLEIKPARLL